MSLSLEQVVKIAPDDASVAAGKKLMGPANWQGLGHNTETLWGLCRGSATYQVKVDLGNLGYHCSCPSRKFPCKHVLGLLMLFAASPNAVSKGEAPDWLSDWLQRRRSREEKKAARETETAGPKKPADEGSQQRRAQARESRVSEGLVRFDVWLKDIARNGLASIENKPRSFWEDQAKRLVDAQAPGLASRVARWATIPRSSPDWPLRLVAEIGRAKLLLCAWQGINSLDPSLRSEVRQCLGWTISQADLEEQGEHVDDTWVVVGQWIDDEDRLRVQRSWLVGRHTNRTALVLQFSAGGQPFDESIVPGSEQRATLLFYPGTALQRAKYFKREGTVAAVTSRPPGAATIDAFLASVAEQLARQPWLTAFGAVLHDVKICPRNEAWLVVDRENRGIPLSGRDHWKLLALAGGHVFDLAGEWDGHALRPLGMYVDDGFRVL